MPTIALLSDIHANVHALTAVLDEVKSLGIDTHVFCGDIVGYGPHSAECVRLVRESGGVAVLGNHDHYTVQARRHPEAFPSLTDSRDNPVLAGIHHALKVLDEDALDWLGTLPFTVEIPGAIVAHAALHNFKEWPYLHDSMAALPTLEILDQSKFQTGFFGHTHRQESFCLPGKPSLVRLDAEKFQLQADSVCAVVVGSVGQPRTGDNRAAWTLWDSDARTFEFRRTAYPFEQTAQEIIDAGLPISSASRLMGRF